mgnify:CR=1 FL=1|jgi:hypothetical protein
MAYRSTPTEEGGVEQREGAYAPLRKSGPRYKEFEREVATERQVGGDHYDLPIQPVKYIHANGLGFIEGNIVKYITRHRQKNGAEDIKKIIHYCELLLALEYGDE